MRIKQLQVSGFKSFLEKTPLHFDVPITGIVGPNGCGKSNVVDAIKWVTGELSYKELRGKSSEDLIFAGSDRRPPSSMMEVALTLDNTQRLAPAQYNEYGEITVTRRVFRDGSSEFFINKTPCRLRDITDLFLDTGIGQSSYSIIEQGKVGAIVSGRPEDRRLMLEEAAGITKYKHRKKAAMRKMDATKQNLLRVSDIVKELEKQIASLERQAKKAEKYHVAKNEFESLDLQMSSFEYQTLQEEKVSLIAMDEKQQDLVSSAESNLLSLEADLEREKLELETVNETFQNSQQELFSKKSKIQNLEHEIVQSQASVENSQRQSVLDTEKIQQLGLDLEQMLDRAAKLREEIQTIDSNKTTITTSLAEKKDLFDQSKTELNALETELEETKKEHIRMVTLKTENASKVDSLKNNVRVIEQEMFEAKEDLALIVDELTQTQEQASMEASQFKEIQQLCFGFQENQSALEDQLADTEQTKIQLEEKLKIVQDDLGLKESRLQALTEFTKSYQGYAKTVQNIMNKHHQEGTFSSVKGVLGELIHIDQGYEKCVQAVLSDWIESIVVDGLDENQDLVQFLKEDQKSRALILRPKQLSTDGTAIQDERILGTLNQWVTLDIQDQPAILQKLTQTYVVENLAQALSVTRDHPSIDVVTRDGDYLQANGVCHVGPFNDVRGDLEVRQEIEKIKEQISPLALAKRDLVEQKAFVEDQFKKVRDHLMQLSQDIKRENQKSSEIEMRLQKLQGSVEFLEKRKLEREKQIVSFKDRIENSENEMKLVQASLEETAVKIAGVESLIQEKGQLFQENRQAFEAYQKGIHEFELELSKMLERFDSLEREKSHLEYTVSSTKEQIQRLDAEKTAHLANVDDKTNLLVQLKMDLESYLQSYDDQEKINSDLRIKHDQWVERIRQIENNAKELRQDKETQQQALNQLRIRLSEVGVKMENLQTQVFEVYEKNIIECIQEISQTGWSVSKETWNETKSKRDELKNALHKFGNVNLAAIEEIGELKERYDFLTAQHKDLETSLATLLDAIKTINKTTKEMFETTYNEVNERFQRIFPRLFRGGKARLMLTDPENILESGVDIYAQPPGKKLQNMNLLSGGEKALTAIALLFAIFEYKAPPFCVLDEVDAPLDDANVLRYVAMVKEMSENTQFIVITHNKSTMQMANNLYGITMEEPGVSRTVSVRLQQENVHTEEAFFEAKSVA